MSYPDNEIINDPDTMPVLDAGQHCFLIYSNRWYHVIGKGDGTYTDINGKNIREAGLPSRFIKFSRD